MKCVRKCVESHGGRRRWEAMGIFGRFGEIAHWAVGLKGWWHLPPLGPFAGTEISFSHIRGWPLEGLSARPSVYRRECRPCIHLCAVRFAAYGLVYELRSLWFQDVESSRRARHRPTGATPARWTRLPPTSSHHPWPRMPSLSCRTCPLQVYLRPPCTSLGMPSIFSPA